MSGERPRPPPGEAMRSEQLVHRVASQLGQERVGDRERDHRFADHRCRRHGAGVAALDVRRVGQPTREVDAAQRCRHGGERLHRRAHDQRLAVADAALEPAGAIRLARDPAARAPHRVVHLRAEERGISPAVAQLDGLDGGNAGERAGEEAVETQVVLRVAAQPGDEAGDAHFEDAAYRVAAGLRFFDGHLESFLCLRIEGAHRRGIGAQRQRFGVFAGLDEIEVARMGGADCGDPGADAHVQLVEKPAHGGAERDAHRGLARAGPLQGISQIFMPELDRPGQVGMPWPRQRHELARIGDRLDRHALGPGFGMIGVLDQDRERRAQGAAVAHAGEDARLLRLDGHPPAAAVAELAPLQVALEMRGQQLQPRRQAVENAHQGRSVRLAGCEKAQPAHASAACRRSRARKPRSGRCSQISSEAMA